MKSLAHYSKLLTISLMAAAISACGGSDKETDPPSSSASSVSSMSSANSVSSVNPASSMSSAVSSSSIASSVSSVPASSSSASSASSVASSSVVGSSTSSVSNSSAGTADLLIGQGLYEEQCAGCHGDQGQGALVFPAIDASKAAFSPSTEPTLQLSLVDYIDQFMGAAGDPAKCTIANGCAAPVAAFIKNSFSVSDVPVVSEEERAERVSKGEAFYRDPRVNCIVCHGNDGTKTVGDGKSLENCSVCTSWTELRDFIHTQMPLEPEGGSSETGPDICTIENECANYTADWIWNKVNNWALIAGGGVRIETEDRLGQDTRRIKSYEMLKADFTRVFGEVPANLEASANAFKAAPDYWYDEPEMGAVSLNVLANASVQSCQNESLPAITDAALRASCADWAERMWLRDATTAELDSCVSVAMEDTTGLSDKERAVFTCVSMMISLPALTY